MSSEPVTPEDLRGVFAVPPLPRRTDARRTLDLDEAERVAAHVARGGITRFLYGGNAFLYHVTLAEYEALLDWLAGFPKRRWAIPSVGPSFGRAIDQARLLRRHSLPVRDGAAVQRSARCGGPGSRPSRDRGRGGSAPHPLSQDRGRLVRKRQDGRPRCHRRGSSSDGVCVAIKYAVVRPDPVGRPVPDGAARARGPREGRVSGMGERPAVVHLQAFELAGLHDRLRLPRPSLSATRCSPPASPGLDGGRGRCGAAFLPARGPARRVGPRARPPRTPPSWRASPPPAPSRPTSPPSTSSARSWSPRRARVARARGAPARLKAPA